MARDDIPEIIKRVRQKIKEKDPRRKMDLQIADDDYRIEEYADGDDPWVHVCVTIGKKGISAYDIAELLTNIEEEVRQEFKNVLIVPTLAEWNP
jgi:hypothetical protein